ncbi:MAG: DUF1552 domain-containing protein [Planctomycetaceae bacterium]|nr:DUF1552 domain-containing protein [Planctomycetaceae bacterium]
MHATSVRTRPAMNRRHLLRAAGAVTIGLPFLEAMVPHRLRAADKDTRTSPRRFVAACATLGFHTPFLIPEATGAEYQLTPYLKTLAQHRDSFTVLSGFSHPNQQGNNGHASELTWLTSAPRPGLAGFRNTISLDQLIADQIGIETRFPFLALSTSGRSMSWTSSGVEIPGETSPEKLFRSLFVNGTEQEVAAEMRELQRGRSILDVVGGEARRLHQDLGVQDRRKLDEYLTAVRDLESRLQQSQGWATRPKPHTEAVTPRDVVDRNDAIAKQKLMYEMIVLALQSDSTRTVTFQLSGMNAVPSNINGVRNDWHNLSHHGRDPEKIEELRLIEEAEFAAFNEFLSRLQSVEEHGRPLLDQTTVLFGSNLGNASAHDWHNLPLILAGGRFRHGTHVAHDAQANTPLANLFVMLAQQMGLEIDQFGSSTSASISGLHTI